METLASPGVRRAPYLLLGFGKSLRSVARLADADDRSKLLSLFAAVLVTIAWDSLAQLPSTLGHLDRTPSHTPLRSLSSGALEPYSVRARFSSLPPLKPTPASLPPLNKEDQYGYIKSASRDGT